MPYLITTQRGELTYVLGIDSPRYDAMDDAARAVAHAFEVDSASNPDYGTSPVSSSIAFTASVTTTTTDTVPLAV